MDCLYCGAKEQPDDFCGQCLRALPDATYMHAPLLPHQDGVIACVRCKRRGFVRTETDVLVSCPSCNGIGHIAA